MILGSEMQGENAVITAEVPLAETFGYSTDLRSQTQGQGTFTMELASYKRVPSKIQEEIIAAAEEGRVGGSAALQSAVEGATGRDSFSQLFAAEHARVGIPDPVRSWHRQPDQPSNHFFSTVQRHGAAGAGNRRREGDFFGTDDDAVLRIAALLNATGGG